MSAYTVSRLALDAGVSHRVVEHGISGACHQCFAWQRHGAGRHIVAISVAAGVGAHQPDRRLPMAQQRQGRCGEV